MQTADRRPIAARGHPLARAIAAWLVRRQISANSISIFGLLCGLAAGLAFAATHWVGAASAALWLSGAVLIQLRLAANMFDGMVALERGIASPVGELYNEIPDRISDSAVLIGAGVAGGNWGLGVAAALAAVATAYVRAAGKAAGAPSDFSGPMAKPQRMFLMTLMALWFSLAPVSWQPALAGLTLPSLALIVVIVGCIVTIPRRLRRIAGMLRRGDGA
ncbi:MAG TPA: CDP-alcohol phosphatidyltransferase family protein [Stellaceae bacterium]|nr:CDP-alcohol phosphatidyltransferase family protein [Stellaceae bacterium]